METAVASGRMERSMLEIGKTTGLMDRAPMCTLTGRSIKAHIEIIKKKASGSSSDRMVSNTKAFD